MTNTKTPTPAPTAVLLTDETLSASEAVNYWYELNGAKPSPVVIGALTEGRITLTGVLPTKHTICGSIATATSTKGANDKTLLDVIRVVRECPIFDDGGPLAEMMDDALAGKPPTLLDSITRIANGIAPTKGATPEGAAECTSCGAYTARACIEDGCGAKEAPAAVEFLQACRRALVSLAHAAEKHGIYQTDYERFSKAVDKFATAPAPQAATTQPRVTEQADERAPLDDFAKWLASRGALGPGPVTERVFIAGWLAGNRRATKQAAPEAPTLSANWRDKLRWSKANTDYHGLIAFTPAQLEHFVSMLVPVAAPEAPTSEQQAKPAAWIDKFNNVWPLGAHSPDGKPNYHDANKRGWEPLFRASPLAAPEAPASEQAKLVCNPSPVSRVSEHFATHAATTASAPIIPHELAYQPGDGEASTAYVNGWNDCRDTMMGGIPDDHTNRPATAASPSGEAERMTTDESREYLVKFMEQHFTDKTFHRYIRGGRDRVNLAGDFAWQMARALRMIDRSASAPSEAAPLDAAADANDSVIIDGYAYEASTIKTILRDWIDYGAEAHDERQRAAARAGSNAGVARTWANFEAWLASDIKPPASATEYARQAFEAGRAGTVGEAARDGWKVLANEAPGTWSAEQKFDVVLDNGVTLENLNHQKIDWTAVRDWRFAAPSRPDEPAGEGSAK